MRGRGGPRRSPAVWIIAAAALLGLGLALFLVLHEETRAKEAGELRQALAAADRDIAGGFYDHARRFVQRAARAAATREDWLSVAKRAYQISEGEKSYELLRTVALRGTRRLPGATELWALVVFADDRTGRYSEAITLSERHLRGSDYAGLKTEAVLRAYPAIKPSSISLDTEGRSYVEAITSKSPDLFQRLAQETGNRDFLIDAILLDAYRGDLAGAYKLLITLRSEASPELGMLVSYDANELDAALNYFDSMPPEGRSAALELLSIDIRMLQKHYDEAAARYRLFIQQQPSYSWIPYANLGWLSGRSDDPRATGYLEEGDRLFPDRKEIALSLAEAYRLDRDPAKAAAVLEQYLKANPDDLDANLLSLRVSGASGSPESYRSRLWQLFYQSARGAPVERARIARYLGWYLFGIHDYEGIELVLRQMQESANEGWYLFYQGALTSVRQDLSSALTYFEKSSAAHEQWQTEYNIGLLEEREGDYTRAVDSLQKADLLLQQTAPVIQSPDRAQIHVELANALYLSGNTEGAKRELLYAMDIDPSNLAGALLLRKLESAAEK